MTRLFAPPPPNNAEIGRICREVLGESPKSVEILRPGAWSSAIGLDTNRGRYVLRFSSTDDDFRSDAYASRFASATLPIPQVVGIGQHDGRWWCLSQRMLGIHLEELDAQSMSAVLPSLVTVLKSIKSRPANHSTGYGHWDHRGNGKFGSFADFLLDVESDDRGNRTSGWRSHLARHHRSQRVFDAGLVVLKDHLRFVPITRQLIHRDTLNANVTVTDDRISGMFDWGSAMWGDALYELAWIRFVEMWFPRWESISLADKLEEAVGIDGVYADERMRCYLLHIGLGAIRQHALFENMAIMNEMTDVTEALL